VARRQPSARASSTAEIQSGGEASQVPPPGFIGYDGDVVTYHYGPTRQGQNTLESILTPANVHFTSFGKIRFFVVDGKVDAQPLYVYRLPAKLHTQNTLFVVTEHGSAYAFDADAGTQSWKVSTLAPGESPSDDMG
jgi:glucose dehydrogenase